MKNIIAVGAGKGGVGKTTMAVNLALALAQHGSRVGLLDADIYGPNVPIMLGVQASLETDGQKIVPIQKHGLWTVSMGFLAGDSDPVIWRGPMLHGVLRQFLQDVAWPALDYLIVDMPPGTGDVALSLSQHTAVTGAVVVTTPQTVVGGRFAARDPHVPEAEHPGAGPRREHELLRVSVVQPRDRLCSAAVADDVWPRN